MLSPAPSTPRRIYAGTSGWAYSTWKPGFYPATQSPRRFLEFYATRLNAVEVNYTFRKLPTPATVDTWLAATPRDFRFSFKAPQRITHSKRLRECHDAVAEFCAFLEPFRAAGKLGPVLFQLPPNFKSDPGRLAAFLAAPALCCSKAPRIAFEFRHGAWFSEAIYAVLRAANAALCIAEGDDLITPEVHTASHACFRLRRSGGYTPRQLGVFVKRLQATATEREVFAFFRHEDEPTGALNAVAFLRRAARA